MAESKTIQGFSKIDSLRISCEEDVIFSGTIAFAICEACHLTRRVGQLQIHGRRRYRTVLRLGVHVLLDGAPGCARESCCDPSPPSQVMLTALGAALGALGVVVKTSERFDRAPRMGEVFAC